MGEMPDTQLYEMSIEAVIMDHFMQNVRGCRPPMSTPHYSLQIVAETDCNRIGYIELDRHAFVLSGVYKN